MYLSYEFFSYDRYNDKIMETRPLKRELRRQTKKRTILCFDLFCARKSIENTSVERRAKESSQMSGLNIFFSTLIQTESTSYGVRCLVMFLPTAFHMKQSVRVMVWGGITGHGLTKLNTLPTGQTLTFGHYMNQIVNPLPSRGFPH